MVLLQLVFIAVCVASENVGFARLVFTPAMPLYIRTNIKANPAPVMLENPRPEKSEARNALFPLPPTGLAHFFCEKFWAMKTPNTNRRAAGLGRIERFSFCAMFGKVMKRRFTRNS